MAHAFARDLRILAALLRGQGRAGSHAERLERFYAPQAEDYDRFRARLLQGRAELIEQLPLRDGDVFVELGGGTGQNLDFFGPRLARLGRIDVVDLCPSLLARVAQRATACPTVRAVEADATTYRPDGRVDCVYFSYALSMIPDWTAALDNAVAMLRPGGTLGIVDFFVSERLPTPGRVRHGMLTRRLWPRWFGHDGVRLDPQTPQRALTHPDLEVVRFVERRAAVPYVPALRVPYFIYVGVKTGGDTCSRPRYRCGTGAGQVNGARRALPTGR